MSSNSTSTKCLVTSYVHVKKNGRWVFSSGNDWDPYLPWEDLIQKNKSFADHGGHKLLKNEVVQNEFGTKYLEFEYVSKDDNQTYRKRTYASDKIYL